MDNLYQVGGDFGNSYGGNMVDKDNNPSVALAFHFDKDTFYPIECTT